MAHKKGVGSSRNGRDSQSQRRGTKAHSEQFVTGGSIIIRQCGNKWYPGRNAGQGTATIWLYEFIGEDLFGEGTAAKTLCREISALKVDRIEVRINSEGGSVFDGMAIHNALRAHPAEVVAYVDYLAASIASATVP